MLRGDRVPSENVVKWYGGVVQVAPASEVKYIVPAFQCSQLRQLLWQNSSPGRCGVTFADCCCGSIDVAASHSHTAVAAAETLRRHIRTLLLRQQRRCGVTLRLLLRQQSAPSPAMSYASRVSGVIERRMRQLLRLLSRGSLAESCSQEARGGMLRHTCGAIVVPQTCWTLRSV